MAMDEGHIINFEEDISHESCSAMCHWNCLFENSGLEFYNINEL